MEKEGNLPSNINNDLLADLGRQRRKKSTLATNSAIAVAARAADAERQRRRRAAIAENPTAAATARAKDAERQRTRRRMIASDPVAAAAARAKDAERQRMRREMIASDPVAAATARAKDAARQRQRRANLAREKAAASAATNAAVVVAANVIATALSNFVAASPSNLAMLGSFAANAVRSDNLGLTLGLNQALAAQLTNAATAQFASQDPSALQDRAQSLAAGVGLALPPELLHAHGSAAHGLTPQALSHQALTAQALGHQTLDQQSLLSQNLTAQGLASHLSHVAQGSGLNQGDLTMSPTHSVPTHLTIQDVQNLSSSLHQSQSLSSMHALLQPLAASEAATSDTSQLPLQSTNLSTVLPTDDSPAASASRLEAQLRSEAQQSTIAQMSQQLLNETSESIKEQGI